MRAVLVCVWLAPKLPLSYLLDPERVRLCVLHLARVDGVGNGELGGNGQRNDGRLHIVCWLRGYLCSNPRGGYHRSVEDEAEEVLARGGGVSLAG